MPTAHEESFPLGRGAAVDGDGQNGRTGWGPPAVRPTVGLLSRG